MDAEMTVVQEQAPEASEMPEVLVSVRDLKKQFAAWLDRQQPPVVFPMEQFEKFKGVE